MFGRFTKKGREAAAARAAEDERVYEIRRSMYWASHLLPNLENGFFPTEEDRTKAIDAFLADFGGPPWARKPESGRESEPESTSKDTIYHPELRDAEQAIRKHGRERCIEQAILSHLMRISQNEGSLHMQIHTFLRLAAIVAQFPDLIPQKTVEYCIHFARWNEATVPNLARAFAEVVAELRTERGLTEKETDHFAARETATAKGESVTKVYERYFL